jgi:hypothetical protein
MQTRDAFADPVSPIAHFCGMDRAADRQKLGEERGGFSERRAGRELCCDISELGRDAAVQHECGKTPRHIGNGTAAGTDLEPPHSQRYLAKQGPKGPPSISFAGTVRSVRSSRSTELI